MSWSDASAQKTSVLRTLGVVIWLGGATYTHKAAPWGFSVHSARDKSHRVVRGKMALCLQQEGKAATPPVKVLGKDPDRTHQVRASHSAPSAFGFAVTCPLSICP